MGPTLIGVGLGLGLSNWAETANNIAGSSLIFVVIGLMVLLIK